MMLHEGGDLSPVDSSAKIDDADQEVGKTIAETRQKLLLAEKIRTFNDICWDFCIEKPASKMDSRTETCLSNCVNRFIDVSLFIRQRFTQSLMKNA